MIKKQDNIGQDNIGDKSNKETSTIDEMSFEDALAALEEVVRNLEQGNTSLDEAMHIYERGNALRRHCAKKLEQAKMRVDKILIDPKDGTSAVGVTSLD